MRTQADQTLVEVPLKNGSTWTGTEAQLRREHPTWVKHARIVQPTPTQDYSSDVLTEAEQDFYDDPRPGRLPSSARRYNPQVWQQGNTRYEYRPTVVQTKIPPRRSAQAPVQETEDIPQAKPKRQRRGLMAHPLLYLGIGMLAMLALWVGLQWLGSWWQLHQDDATYGRPRTYQFDAVFGHSDSPANPTHIIIVNLNRHVIVIELPGGDPTHSRIYSGPTLFGDGQDLTPVTGKAIDVNGDGKLDLVLFIGDQRIVYINDGTQFRPLKPGEHVTIPQ